MWKVETEWLWKAEKKLLMHLARNESCADVSVVAFVDSVVFGHAAAVAILAAAAVDAAEASAR